MGLDDSCNAGLVLGLSLTPSSNNIAKKSLTLNLDDGNYHDSPCFDAPSLTLSLSGDSFSRKTEETTFTAAAAAAGDPLCQQQASSHSGVSSFSVKREREMGLEEAETERVSSRAISDDHEDEDGVSPRKKLRLTKEQSALLEESFKQHSSLNPKQKQVLARQLNLRPRQVEVWFQNRRARTKLKQTEVDYEFLKKCCENLTDENRRLQKEVEELKALKLARPFYMHMPAATLAICPSCERIGAGNGDGAAVKTLTFSISAKSHFFNPFANPSAAC